MKLKIRDKLLIYILSTVVVIYTFSFGYFSFVLHKVTKEDAVKISDAVVGKYASLIGERLNSDIDVTRTMVNSFSGFKNLPIEMLDTIYSDMLYHVLTRNPQFSAISMSWELNAIDTTYKLPYGRKRTTYYYSNGQVFLKKDLLDLTGDNLTRQYYSIKTQKQEVITPPYFYSYTGSKDDEQLMTTAAVPILIDGKFAGLVGTDILLEDLINLFDEFKTFESSEAFIVANNGNVVASKDKAKINFPIDKLYENEVLPEIVTENIKNGTLFTFYTTDADGKEYFNSFSPIHIGRSNTPWTVGVKIPTDKIMFRVSRLTFYSFLVGLAGIIILTVVIYFVAKNIASPLGSATKSLKELSLGNIQIEKNIDSNRDDEIGEISESINSLIDGLQKTTQFAKQIGEGNFDAKYQTLSDKDVLGIALIEMGKSLRLADEEDKKRKEEDRRMNWATEGTAVFAEILRQGNTDLKQYCYSIISNLVKYINVNQGGLFIINDTNKNNVYIELMAAYAFDRQKNLEKKIPMGVGLVGRCVQENETIYMTTIPEDYLNITSGLGEKKPGSILIVPLRFNEQTHAVVELASFREIAKHEIDFVERIGQSIASSLATLKINIQTAMLLQESKIQSEELASQEEEMRQNMEEMLATQEELSRTAAESKSILEAVNSISLVVEFDMQGKIIEINELFLNLLGRTREEMIGLMQGSYSTEVRSYEEFNEFWADLRRGKTRHIVQNVKINNREFWFSEAYTPIYNNQGQPYKVLNISIDITESINKQVNSSKNKISDMGYL